VDIQDIAGIAGAALIIVAYLLLQLRKIDAENVWFSVVNAGGAALILASLWFDFNLAAAIIESFWLLISLYGVGVAINRPQGDGESAAH